jgi:hypothetical protein
LAGRSQSEGRAASAVRKGFSLESWHGLVFAVSDDGREAHKKKDSDEECLSAERKKLFPRSAQKSEVSSRTFFLLL